MTAEAGVLNGSHDRANARLRGVNAGAASAVPTHRGGLAENGVWADVYDSASGAVRFVVVN